MECIHEDTADGIRIIRLAGRMDIQGSSEIDLRFMTLVSTGGKAIVVDLSGLEFLSSLGIGTLVMAAKNVLARKGLLVMYGAAGVVEKALIRSHLPAEIPQLANLDEARARVLALVKD